jgi:magnesium transporter
MFGVMPAILSAAMGARCGHAPLRVMQRECNMRLLHLGRQVLCCRRSRGQPNTITEQAPDARTRETSMLINCSVYQDGKKIAEIAPDAIKEFVCRPDCFIWVALRDASDAELDELQAKFELHELAVDDARHGHQRPKIQEYGKLLFAVAHLIECRDGELNIGEVDVFVAERFVVSIRNRSEQGFLGVRARCEAEPELLKFGSGFVFYALIDAVVERYFPVLEQLEHELERIEERIFAGKSVRSNIEDLYSLKQKATTLQHAVAPLLEDVSKLYGGRVPQVVVGTQEYYRDVFDHLYRINHSINSLRDMVTTAISVNLSLITLQENETTKRLASYAALLAVPTMVAGIYGMNFKNMPELNWEWGYPCAIGLMAIIDVFLYTRFKKARWL